MNGVIHYFPSWNGDFRLEGLTKKTSILKISKPTVQETNILTTFLAKAHKKKWTDRALVMGDDGTQNIELSAKLDAVQKVLLKMLRPKKTTLTAVKFSDGKVVTEHGTSDETVTTIATAIEKADKPANVVSVRRHTPSCPQCIPGSIAMASEVLLKFLSPAEHESWARCRQIIVEGGYTGHRYLIAHRHSRLAQKMGRIAFDLDDDCVVHFHDWGVPPEEEVLAAKLIFEHREDWLRNEATMLDCGGRRTEVFKNPFGDGMDGVESHSFVQGFGKALMGMFGVKDPRKVLVGSGYTGQITGEMIVNAQPVFEGGNVAVEMMNGVPYNAYGQPLF